MNVRETDFIINIVVIHMQGFPSEILMIFLLYVCETDFIINIVVTHVQGFPSEILMIFFVRNCVKCEAIWINVWHC